MVPQLSKMTGNRSLVVTVRLPGSGDSRKLMVPVKKIVQHKTPVYMQLVIFRFLFLCGYNDTYNVLISEL